MEKQPIEWDMTIESVWRDHSTSSGVLSTLPHIDNITPRVTEDCTHTTKRFGEYPCFTVHIDHGNFPLPHKCHRSPYIVLPLQPEMYLILLLLASQKSLSHCSMLYILHREKVLAGNLLTRIQSSTHTAESIQFSDKISIAKTAQFCWEILHPAVLFFFSPQFHKTDLTKSRRHEFTLFQFNFNHEFYQHFE